jgi:hypothetical protein
MRLPQVFFDHGRCVSVGHAVKVEDICYRDANRLGFHQTDVILFLSLLPMKRITAFFALVALLAAAACAQPAAGQDGKQLFQEIEAIVSDLGEITGLKPTKPLRPDLIGRDQVKQFLEQRIKEEVKPEELRAEELTLKKFGFVPADFDLKQTTIELLTEQAAALYDYRKKRLYVLDSSSSTMQEVALVHELAHALADQRFNLEKFISRAGENDDGAMARLAVMEGQATWLMSEYLARRMGMSLKTSPTIAQYMSQQAGTTGGQFPVFDKAPLYIRETLIFPYTKGMLFQHVLVEKEGQAGFSSVFSRPPVSTQQILHPDKYFGGVRPTQPALPRLASQGDFRVLMEGSIGELDHSILLRQFAGPAEAEEVAPQWKGGAYRLLEHKKDRRAVLAYASEWQDPAVAKRFFELYRVVLKGKWKSMEVTEDRDGYLTGRGDDGHFILRLNGVTITCLQGMSSLSEAGEGLR